MGLRVCGWVRGAVGAAVSLALCALHSASVVLATIAPLSAAALLHIVVPVITAADCSACAGPLLRPLPAKP